jgi:hypothetical protein
MIQNADDNTYLTQPPIMKICYSEGFLRLDSNEVGFTRANVDAICSIGKSSKLKSLDRTRAIGKKGIGFKSVFKIADSVWIASGHYSFKFDKSQLLGMIAPIWEKFPQTRSEGWTSFLLKLSPGCDTVNLVSQLRSLDSRTLIFLRKLVEVKVEISDDHVRPVASLTRRDMSGFSGLQQLILEGDECSPFIVSRHSLPTHVCAGHDLPIDLGDIWIVFPSIPAEAPAKTHNTFSFLPIRNYGLKVSP